MQAADEDGVEREEAVEWKKAIIQVLEKSLEPRHYTDIAEEVAKKKFRKPNEMGATPANTVAVAIGNSLRDEGEGSPFVRVGRGYYSLRQSEAQKAAPEEEATNTVVSSTSGIINALGMFWDRSKVLWRSEPKLLGRQQQAAEPVDFGKQVGIYFLHDTQGVVYVGRVTDQSLAKRLQQHTVDRLSGRWDRFSWFGVYPVKDDGSLRSNIDFSNLGLEAVISTLEAVLIEGLEPRQNRRRGDALQAIEFVQVEDPGIEQARRRTLLSEIAAQLGEGRG